MVVIVCFLLSDGLRHSTASSDSENESAPCKAEPGSSTQSNVSPGWMIEVYDSEMPETADWWAANLGWAPDDAREPGAIFRLHGSSDLRHWTPLAIVTNQANLSIWTDPQANSHGHRFYRASRADP